ACDLGGELCLKIYFGFNQECLVIAVEPGLGVLGLLLRFQYPYALTVISATWGFQYDGTANLLAGSEEFFAGTDRSPIRLGQVEFGHLGSHRQLVLGVDECVGPRGKRHTGLLKLGKDLGW